MPRELSVKKTIVSLDRMLEALAIAWIETFNEQPSKQSILILLSQGALETGRFKKMYCFNIGNIKSLPSDGRDYTYYTCNEILSVSKAKQLINTQVEDGGKVEITRYLDNDKCLTYFYPKHYICRFRAFSSLEEGAIDYLSFLYKKYKPAWQAVLSGDPVVFCKKLKELYYYTADVNEYTRSVVSLYNEFSKLPFDLDNLPIMSTEKKTRVLDLVNLSLQDLANNLK